MAARAKPVRAWSVGFNVAIDGPLSTLDAIAALTAAATVAACTLSHIQANENRPGYGTRLGAMLPGDVILPGQPFPSVGSTLEAMAAAEAQAHREIAAGVEVEAEVAPSYGVTFTLSIRDPDVVGAGDAVEHARRVIDRLTEAGVTCHVNNVNATRETPDMMELLPEVARTIGRAMNRGVDGERWKDDDDEGLAD